MSHRHNMALFVICIALLLSLVQGSPPAPLRRLVTSLSNYGPRAVGSSALKALSVNRSPKTLLRPLLPAGHYRTISSFAPSDDQDRQTEVIFFFDPILLNFFFFSKF